MIAYETWQLASRRKASGTREYIGSVTGITDLVEGRGEFDSADAFYEYWRDTKRRWKESPEAVRLLQKYMGDHA